MHVYTKATWTYYILVPVCIYTCTYNLVIEMMNGAKIHCVTLYTTQGSIKWKYQPYQEEYQILNNSVNDFISELCGSVKSKAVE